jgi:ribosomal protein S18 acetylase RimI-like enzyme
LTIRRLNPDDAEAVLHLWKVAETSESPTDSLVEIRQAAARANVAFLVAVEGDDIVGSAIGAFDGWRGNIYRLAVHPAHRRQGIARALVAETEGLFAGWGVRRVTALVDTKHSWAAQFWEAVGFAKDSRMARYVRNLAGGGAGAA